MKQILFITTFLLFFLPKSFAQVDDVLESLEDLEVSGENAEDLLDATENVLLTPHKKYNINDITNEQMTLLGFNNMQIFCLNAYIMMTGQIYSLNELRFINGFSKEFIEKISPYIYVEPIVKQPPLRLDSIFKNAKQSIRLTYNQNLRQPYGYTRTDGKGYKGKNFASTLRYQLKYFDKMEFSFTADKDYGEPLIEKGKTFGYDFYNLSLTFRDLTKHIKQITLGNYRLNIGEGLLMKQSFSLGYMVGNYGAKHSNYDIMPFRSSTEYNYNTGLSTKLQFGKFDVLLFGSYNGVDFNGKSIQQTGYHRTENELKNKDSNHLTMGGTSIQYYYRGVNLGANFILYHFEDSLKRGNSLYQQYDFQGKTNNVISLNGSYAIKQLLFFGEVARSQNNAFAGIGGLQISVGYKSNISITLRDYSHRYQNFYADAIGVQSRNHNEKGVYVDYSKYINNRLDYYLAADLYHFSYPSYRANKSTTNYKLKAQLRYKPTEKQKIILYFSAKNRQYNDTTANGIEPCDNIIVQSQLKYGYDLTSWLTLEDRVGYSHSFTNDSKSNYGYYNYLELIAIPKQKWNIRFRWTYFKTTDYDNRFYVYEYSIPLTYSSSLLYRTGNKFYVNIAYKPNEHLNFYLKYSLTRYNNLDEISSSNDKLEGNYTHYLYTQILYKF